MKQNKGQVLVAFLLLLPLLFLLIVSLLDFGFLSIQKRQIESGMHIALHYASENQTSDALEEEVTELLNKNIPGITSLKTIKEDTYFEIEVTCQMRRLLKNTFRNSTYKVVKRKEYREKGD